MIREDGTVIFTPDVCDDCKHIVSGWCWEDYFNTINAPYMNKYKNQETQTLRLKNGKFTWHINKRLVKDPRKEKTKQWRKRGGRNFWKKELPHVSKKLNRSFRRKMKQDVMNEIYYNPIPHDYHTYGWESW